MCRNGISSTEKSASTAAGHPLAAIKFAAAPCSPVACLRSGTASWSCLQPRSTPEFGTQDRGVGAIHSDTRRGPLVAVYIFPSPFCWCLAGTVIKANSSSHEIIRLVCNVAPGLVHRLLATSFHLSPSKTIAHRKSNPAQLPACT